MKIVITPRIINITPYISTTWNNIASLYIDQSGYSLVLVIEQFTGGKVEIPDLDGITIEKIFSMHSSVLEKAAQPAQQVSSSSTTSLSVPIPMDMLGEVEKMGTLLEHNPEASDTPNLPAEILKRIGQVVQAMGLEDTSGVPEAEFGCNCTFCQISRAIHGDTNPSEPEAIVEEEVTDEDLRFRTWDIDQKGTHLFQVSNPLDKEEHYDVFLGEPIGCTCGSRNCEHVRAVLST